MVNYTHEIVRMERGATKTSGSPMWRCTTADGQLVNVFQHSDPTKNTAKLFLEADYFHFMESLKIGEAIEWSGNPIKVVMASDGKWWEVRIVLPRPADAEPDVMWQPFLEGYRRRAHTLAGWLLRRGNETFCVDLELTGLRTDDEVVAIAIVDLNGQVHLDSLVQPEHPEKLLRKQKNGLCAADITGITADQLIEAPTFSELYADILDNLDGKRWVAYNAGFDVGALDRAASNAQMPMLMNNGVFDVAVIAAEYLGNWNAKRQWFEMLKLGEAATRLGVVVDVQHHAAADALTTLKVLKAIADDVLGAFDETRL